MMTVYADELFAVNFISNILLFYAYALLHGIKRRRLRIITASAAGAVYAVIEAVLYIPMLFRAAVLAVMTVTAFGRARAVLNTLGIMFTAVCAEGITAAVLAFSGADARLASGAVTVFAPEAAAALAYFAAYPAMLLYKRIFRRGGRYKSVVLFLNGIRVSFRVMYDSGNLLKYKGLPVIIANWKEIRALFGCGTYAELIDCLPDMISYGTIGKSGVMPVFIPDKCTIDGMECAAAAAVTERGFKGCGGIAGDID